MNTINKYISHLNVRVYICIYCIPSNVIVENDVYKSNEHCMKYNATKSRFARISPQTLWLHQRNSNLKGYK